MFDYDDLVRVKANVLRDKRPGEKGWIIGVTPDEKRRGAHFAKFPAGVVYLVEFEDGGAIDFHESDLESGDL